MNIHETLGNNFFKLRIAKQLTQKEVGEKIGIHKNYISALERGKCNPRVKKIEKLAKALDVCPTKLFEPITATKKNNILK